MVFFLLLEKNSPELNIVVIRTKTTDGYTCDVIQSCRVCPTLGQIGPSSFWLTEPKCNENWSELNVLKTYLKKSWFVPFESISDIAVSVCGEEFPVDKRCCSCSKYNAIEVINPQVRFLNQVQVPWSTSKKTTIFYDERTNPTLS